MPVCNISSQIVIHGFSPEADKNLALEFILKGPQEVQPSLFFFTQFNHPEGAAGSVYGPGTNSGSEPVPCWSKGTDCNSQL